MRCPICGNDATDEQTERWGPEFAHSNCVKAYGLGQSDERERCATLCEWLPIGTGLQGKTFAEAIRKS